jgi:hypothetical protein
LLFTAGAFVEGGGTKVWQRLTRVLVTSVPTQSDVRAMAVSDDFLYLASNLPGGTIEVCQLFCRINLGSFTHNNNTFDKSFISSCM